jgi:hypothetical protein
VVLPVVFGDFNAFAECVEGAFRGMSLDERFVVFLCLVAWM